jgi:thiol-disulfide isomerase/thioredoxin
LLNNDGSLAETQVLDLQGEKLDSRLLGAWMAKLKLPNRDAQQMLDTALAQAQAGRKRVFLILSASWCGPCRMLARFLAPHKVELEKHVFVKLDISRDEHIDELRERFKGSADGGVPWFCILDGEAKVLATSNVPTTKPSRGNTNMGFPPLPAEVEHFVEMLKTTAPRLGDEKLAEFKAELLKKK